MVLVIARWEAGLCEQRPNSQIRWFSQQSGRRLDRPPRGQRCSKRLSENDSRQPGNITKNRQSDRLKQKSTYSFTGMMKKGDGEDDEVRTTAKPQVHVAVK
jgi:hypothetical protein